MRKLFQGRSSLVTVVGSVVVLVLLSGGGAVAGSLITSAKIKNNTIQSIDVKNNSLTGADVRNGTIGGADVRDYSLSNQDVNVLYASVRADGSLESGSGGVTAEKLGTGAYGVHFLGRDIRKCAFIAQVADLNDSSAYGETGVADLSGSANGVYVQTADPSGALTNLQFHLTVVC